MFVVIAGGDKVGSHLATLPLGEGHEVRVVEHCAPVVERLRQELLDGALAHREANIPWSKKNPLPARSFFRHS